MAELFCKLASSIIQSSLWNESCETRIVWITLLALKDDEGFVRGDQRTLSRMANVPVEATSAALEAFQQPDPSSRNTEHDGRRIAAAPGGYRVLSHDRYRELGSSESLKSYWRNKKQKKEAGFSETSEKFSEASTLLSSKSVSLEGVKGEKGKRESKRETAPVDDSFVAELGTNAAYEGIDVPREWLKCQQWCATNSMPPSRRRLVNWLNRAEPGRNRGSVKPVVRKGESLELQESLEVPVL